MKHLIFIFFLTTIYINKSGAQLEYNFKIDDEGKVFFDEVIILDGKSQSTLFLKGKRWINKKGWLKEGKQSAGVFMNNKEKDHGEIFFDFEDKDAGVIIGRGRTNILVYNNSGIRKNGGSFAYTLTLQFKDGKTRILIDELLFEGADMIGVNDGAFMNEDYPAVFTTLYKNQIKKQWVLMRQQAIKEFENIISSYKADMLKSESKNDDW